MAKQSYDWLTGIQVRQFMGLRSLDIPSPGKLTIIKGPNHSGKSSALAAITNALLSGGATKYELVRLGPDGEHAEEAEIVLEVADLRIERTYDEKGGSLHVFRGEDDEVKPAQTALDMLVPDAMAFNPLAFYEAKPAEQVNLLLSLVPCATTQDELNEWLSATAGVEGQKPFLERHPIWQEGAHALLLLMNAAEVLETERRDANRDVKKLEGEVKALRPDLPDDFDVEKARALDASALSAAITAAEKAQQQRDILQTEVERAQASVQRYDDRIASLEKQLQEAQAERATAVLAVEQKQAEAAAVEVPDVSAERQQLNDFTAAKVLVSQYDQWQTAKADLAKKKTLAEALDTDLKAARAKPAEILKASSFPIEGVTIEDGTIRINGVRLQDRSNSEQFLFALDVLRLLAVDWRGLKVVFIDEGLEKLDAENLALFRQQVMGDDLQYIVGMVAEKWEVVTATTPEELADPKLFDRDNK